MTNGQQIIQNYQFVRKGFKIMADVFISYSRKDIAFARLLHESLKQGKVETWIDWERIPIGEKWWDEISAAISQSDIFLFIISRHSVGSEICKKEVDQAISHNKRIIPIIVDDTPEAAIREFVPDLTSINWIIFRREDVFLLEARPDANLKPEEQLVAHPKMPEFQQAVEKLNTAIHTDWTWVKAHTRLETRAQEWEKRKQESSLLLRGKDLAEAEAWLAQVGSRKDPQPTQLQRTFVLASRKAENQRQRMTLGASLGALGIISICLVVAIILGVLAYLAQQTAQKNLARSESLRLSAEAENLLTQPYGNIETAALLSLRALQGGYIPQADASLQKSLPGLFATKTFSGHTDKILSVAFSTDGKFILTGSQDGTAKLWDVSSSQVVRTFSGHDGSVESVAFSLDGKYVLTGGSDKTARMWDLVSGAEIRTFNDPTTIERTSVEFKRSSHSVAFSPDGMYVLTASDDGNAKLWDAASGLLVRTFIGHSNIVRSVAFSPDGRFVLTGALDNTARLWDANTGQEVRMFTLSGWVLSVAFSADGKYVLTGGTNDDPIMWNTTTGGMVHTFAGDAKGAISVSFSPDGKYVLTGSLAQPIARLWDVEKEAIVRTYNGHTDSIMSVAFSPDGEHILTGSSDSTAKLWDATSNTRVRTFMGHTDSVWSVAFSPEGKYVLTGSSDNTARLWDTSTFTEIRTFRGHSALINSVAYSQDGKYIMTGSDDGTAKLWNVATGLVVRTFSGHTNSVWSVGFSPDGKYVLTGSYDGTAKLWDATTGQVVHTFNGHTQGVIGVTFSPDGKYALTGSIDWDAILWDVATGAEVRTFKGKSSVEGVAFSPDGKYVLTGNYERTATLWDATTAAEVRTFSGHTSYVGVVTFSPDGKYILTSSYDSTAKLWETATGVEVRTFGGHSAAVTSVAISPDGKYVLTGSMDSKVQLWDMESNDTIRWACAHLTRDLTPEELTRHFIIDDAPTCPPPDDATASQPIQALVVTQVPSVAAVTPPESATLAPTLNSIEPTSTMGFFLLSDSFTSNVNGWEIGEESLSGGKVQRTIADGYYTISLTSETEFFYLLTSIPINEANNFILKVDATVLEYTGTPGNLQLDFSLREVDGWVGKHYSFILLDDGTTYLQLWPSEHYEDVVSLWDHNSNSNLELKKGVPRTISIEMNGPTITVSVNGQQIDSITDATIAEAGSISLGLCLYEAGESAVLAFDNFSISEKP